jgi:hypothetical protein
VVVALADVFSHVSVGIKAFVVFAVSSSAPETVPEMSVGGAYTQGLRALDVRRLVVAAQMLDDFAQVL